MSKINYWAIMTRRKPMPQQECNESSKLGKVFGTFDLTALGVSATLGVGVYVLAGHVAKDQAGPSVILSFLIAAAASFLAGLCYAEFASRVPKSGSAYIFTYVAIGEFLAFIVGWNLILEYIIGAASISKGLSLYIDSLANDAMKNFFKFIAPISWDFLAPYFDFFAFGCPLFIGMALAFGLRKSAGINNVFCILNLGVVAYVVVAVLFNADIKNWQIDPKDIPSQYANTTGTGGFFPFGFSGTLKGAATCFFGFVGFDCIATTGEEVRNPQKTVPRALLYSLAIIFVAYFGVSLLTLMWPYYLLNPEAPLPHAFQEIGWISSKWIVTVGGIVGLLASLFGAMFPLPRILYAMAQDGLLFKEFAVISRRFETPVFGTLCAAFLTGSFSALFDLSALVSMLSIGVLLAYTVVAISIIILRFSQSTESTQWSERYIETSNLLRPGYNITAKGFVMQLIRLNASRQPNTISMWVVGSLIVSYVLVSFGLSFTFLYSWDAVADGETWALSLVLLLTAVLLLFCILISIQPRQKFHNEVKPFKVPIVPFLPAISIFINIYLMLMLDCYTWIRFGVWMIIGIFVYFPCAWLYNFPVKKLEDETIKETTSCNDEIIIVEKANGSVSNDEEYKNNEGAAIKSTCETENVIIVHENLHGRASVHENFINNKLSVETETNLAIEMLDTVLEEADSIGSEINSQRESVQSINSKDVNVLTMAMAREFSYEKSPNLVPTETINHEIIDYDYVRREIEAEIDEILKHAQASAESELNETQSEDENDENVFRNRKFLTHLSDLISTKSNQQTKNVQSKTLERKTETLSNIRPNLKQSKSVPDFKLILNLADKEKTFNDDSSVEYILNNDKVESAVPPPPVFRAELFQRVATLKRAQTLEKSNEELKNPIETKDEDAVENLEDEVIDKENFRDKLEKLLSAPPTRLSLIPPIPLPRTSLIEMKDDNQVLPRDYSITAPAPISATMQKQREAFDEVLKRIKKNENDEKVSLEE